MGTPQAAQIIRSAPTAVKPRAARKWNSGERLRATTRSGTVRAAHQEEVRMDPQPKEVPLRARMDDAVAEGIYVNFGSIAHNRSEFILDLGRLLPGRPDVKILSRLLTTPLVAKQLCRALAQNIEQYEKTYGEIAGTEEGMKRVGF
jgi:hypothetical protein